MIRSRAIVIPVETDQFQNHALAFSVHRATFVALQRPEATAAALLRTVWRFGLVGTFPTVVLSRSILTVARCFLSVKVDIHGPGVQATRVLYAQHHLHVHFFMTTGIFASTCCPKCRGVSGLDEDCSHVNILGHIIEKFVSESGGTTMSIRSRPLRSLFWSHGHLAVIVMTGFVFLLVCQIGESSSFSLRRTVTFV